MIATTHIATGAFIGASVAVVTKKDRRFVALSIYAFVLGMISHFVLDLIPHAEYSTIGNKEEFLFFFIAELAVTFLLIFIATIDLISERKYLIGISVGIIGASISDIPDVFNRVFNIDWTWIIYWMKFNSIFHFDPGAEPVTDITLQILIATLACLALLIGDFFHRIKRQRMLRQKSEERK